MPPSAPNIMLCGANYTEHTITFSIQDPRIRSLRHRYEYYLPEGDIRTHEQEVRRRIMRNRGQALQYVKRLATRVYKDDELIQETTTKPAKPKSLT
jgi:hypothetical protein